MPTKWEKPIFSLFPIHCRRCRLLLRRIDVGLRFRLSALPAVMVRRSWKNGFISFCVKTIRWCVLRAVTILKSEYPFRCGKSTNKPNWLSSKRVYRNRARWISWSLSCSLRWGFLPMWEKRIRKDSPPYRRNARRNCRFSAVPMRLFMTEMIRS